MRYAKEGAAQRRAVEVLKEFGANSWPLQPEKIAASLDIPLESSDAFPPNTYGALIKKGNDFRVVISERCHNDGQRRFTICHEIGHFCLDGHIEALFEGGGEVHLSNTSHFRSAKNWYEVEADAFAAELLVPSFKAREVLRGAAMGVDSVKAIEQFFGTSLSCAAVRYANLSADPVVVILSKGREIEWASFSPSIKVHDFARRRLKGEWLPSSSSTHRIAQSTDRVLSGEVLEDEMSLCEWFDGAPAVPVVEFSQGMGTYGRVLTVLVSPTLESPDVYQEKRSREVSPGDWKSPLREWSWDSHEDVRDD